MQDFVWFEIYQPAGDENTVMVDRGHLYIQNPLFEKHAPNSAGDAHLTRVSPSPLLNYLGDLDI